MSQSECLVWVKTSSTSQKAATVLTTRVTCSLYVRRQEREIHWSVSNQQKTYLGLDAFCFPGDTAKSPALHLCGLCKPVESMQLNCAVCETNPHLQKIISNGLGCCDSTVSTVPVHACVDHLPHDEGHERCEPQRRRGSIHGRRVEPTENQQQQEETGVQLHLTAVTEHVHKHKDAHN